MSYLRSLDTASVALAPARRAALRADVVEHLTESLGASDGSEAAIAEVLEALGPPERLVAEVGGYAGPTPAASDQNAPPPTTTRWPRLEVVALGLLVGSVACCVSVLLFPVAPLPWLLGSVLVLFSIRWSAGDKALALVAYGILGVPFLFFTITGAGGVGWSASCSGGSNPDGSTWELCSGGPPSWWWVVVAVVGLVLLAVWVGAAVRLVHSMRRPVDDRRSLRMG